MELQVSVEYRWRGREFEGWRILFMTEKRVFEFPSLERMRPE